MRAALISAGGATVEVVKRPQPGPTGLVVRVHAAGLSRADILNMQYAQSSHGGSSVAWSGTLPAVIGGEFAGEVVQVGSEVRGISIGDRVMGLGFGAHAEFVLADAGCVYEIPDGMNYQHAASLPVALLTNYNSLFLAGRFVKGEIVLVHGASSAVGLMALQVARIEGASIVIGTSRRSSHRSRLLSYGAHYAIDSGSRTWPAEVLDATSQRGAELILDHVAGPDFNRTMAAAAPGCRIVNVGRLGGLQGSFDFDLHALKRLEYIGATFRGRTLNDYRAATYGVKAVLWDAVVKRQLTVPVDRTFSLDDAADAYRYVRKNDYFGRVLITPIA